MQKGPTVTPRREGGMALLLDHGEIAKVNRLEIFILYSMLSCYLDSFATNRFPTRLSTAHIGESHCS